jgi:alginate O-acetyltransferase complex protein AlgI
MTFNYVIGRSINKIFKNKVFFRRSILIFGVILNLALLGYFKYADFFIENINIYLSINDELPHLNLLLPLAISFFTFQQITYLIDTYRQETREYSFLNYALFVTFFPQLIAGPIVHHKEMMPQFTKIRNKIKNYKNIAMGLFIFSIGLFKKVVIADTFSVWANNGFDVATTLNLIEAWATSLSYTFQLYFDFSGYIDMAIGLALLFNIRLPINFNSPYKATNISDFWRRWHITLSRFLRDYVYIPLGGNRKSGFRTYSNLMATFLIGGLWHGAGWTFVFWGFLHGLALIIQKFWEKFGFKFWAWVAWLITFNFVNIAWVFFRAKEWDDAVKVLVGMIGLSGIKLHPIFQSKLAFLTNYGIEFGYYDSIVLGAFDLLWFIIAFILILLFNNSNEKLSNFKLNYKTVFCSSFAFVGSILLLNKESEFLYFNF